MWNFLFWSGFVFDKICNFEGKKKMMEKWHSSLVDRADGEYALRLQRFFRTGPGEYGEGDRFLGLTVPVVRSVSKTFSDASFEDVRLMLSSPWHECRLSALLVLVEKFRKSRRSPAARRAIVEFYVRHADSADNWDLVDLSAPKILGEWLVGNPDADLLDGLSRSDSIWRQRIAIVSTWAIIRSGRYEETLRLAERYLGHPHDLIHKATGWMLREVGKRDLAVLKDFLDRHADKMPRTALRYAIEKLPEEERKRYLSVVPATRRR